MTTITSFDDERAKLGRSSEPVPAPLNEEAGAGSSHAREPIPHVRDLLRALVCAVLVAASVASPESALVLAPFVPALVAIRLLRQRAGSDRFLVTTGIGATIAAIVSAREFDAYLVGAAAALLLVCALGVLHARAALRDPATTEPAAAWPEPRLQSGLTPTIGAWAIATVLVMALAAPVVDSVRSLGEQLVNDSYGVYSRECLDGGALADRDDFCEEILDQRDRTAEVVGDHTPELFAALAAVFAFGGATTAHLVVLMRARRWSERIRPAWRIRDLEMHWSFAYVLAVGLALWLAAGDGAAALAVAGRTAGAGLAVLGALAVITQGLGLVAWMFTRGGSPTWYRVVLIAFALFVGPVTAAIVFTLGVIDLAMHPRRRAAARDAAT